jgi:polysaccharide pyruvyl transferase WcaK-like protein
MVRKNKRMAIVGYYGYDNLGDDLMLDCLLNKIESRYPDIQIKLLAKWSENLLEITSKYKNVEYIFFRPKHKLRNFWTYLKAILWSDLTVWGGGTCFSDEDGIGNYKYFMLNYFLKKRFAYIGIGIGNIARKESISRTKFLFNKMAFASFRDEKSYLLSKTLSTNKNLYLTGDLSYLFNFDSIKGLKTKSGSSKSKYVLVGLRDLSKYYSPKEIEKRHGAIVSFLIEYALKNDLRVTFLPIDSKKDRDVNKSIANKIAERNPNVVVEWANNSSYEEKIRVISGADLNLSERLHSIVISKFLNVPCIAISYSPKIDRFFAEIKDNRFISYTDDISIFKLRELSDSLHNGNSNAIDVNINDRLRRDAAKNIEIIGKYL